MPVPVPPMWLCATRGCGGGACPGCGSPDGNRGLGRGSVVPVGGAALETYVGTWNVRTLATSHLPPSKGRPYHRDGARLPVGGHPILASIGCLPAAPVMWADSKPKRALTWRGGLSHDPACVRFKYLSQAGAKPAQSLNSRAHGSTLSDTTKSGAHCPQIAGEL